MLATSTRVCCIATVILATVTGASADVVVLKSGGQVRGTLQSAQDAPVVIVETLLGGTVSIEQSSIQYVEERTPLVEEYETRARDVAHEVEAHWELAEWCKANGLKEQRTEQLTLLLDVDQDHVAARRLLGHILYLGEWVTRDEWMTARGFVKRNGKYVRHIKSEAETEAENAWFPTIRVWFTWLLGNRPERAKEAHANFAALDDPDAVPALVNFLGSHQDVRVRLMCVELLSRLPGPKPVFPLVAASLNDSEKEVRTAAVAAIGEDQYAVALKHYAIALRHDTNKVVKRAGVALQEIGDRSIVPDLIKALITGHEQNHIAYYDLTPNVPATMRGTEHLQYGAIYVNNGLQPIPQFVKGQACHKKNIANETVLEALTKITGEDFGFDKRAWTNWWKGQDKYAQE